MAPPNGIKADQQPPARLVRVVEASDPDGERSARSARRYSTDQVHDEDDHVERDAPIKNSA